MSGELVDDWIPENTTTKCSEPVTEREWSGSSAVLLDIHVRVRLSDVDRTVEWRTVKASNLHAAIKAAEAMPDVEVALEASVTPGGPGLFRFENPGEVVQFDGNANLLAMGGIGPQGVPKTFHVNVRLKNDDPKAEWRHEWRQVEAPTLREAMAVAERIPDVAMCVEASVVPGGVAT